MPGTFLAGRQGEHKQWECVRVRGCADNHLRLPAGGLQVMQSAVCPEVRLGLDSAVSAIASVTEVELSKDMQVTPVTPSVHCCAVSWQRRECLTQVCDMLR